jgi:hypothetical protein
MAKPVRSHKQITAVREIIEINLGMIEDAFGLQFQSVTDSMTAINFVNAQIEAEESLIPFPSEAERMGFTRSLHELKLEYETKGKLDLGQTFDKLTRAFRVREETIIEDDTLQAAFTAQIQPQRKFGQLRNDNVKGSSPPSRDRQFKHNEQTEKVDYAKILKVIYDLKADVGTIKKGAGLRNPSEECWRTLLWYAVFATRRCSGTLYSPHACSGTLYSPHDHKVYAILRRRWPARCNGGLGAAGCRRTKRSDGDVTLSCDGACKR